MNAVKPAYNPASHPEMNAKEYSLYHRREYQKWYRDNHKAHPDTTAEQVVSDVAQRKLEYQRRYRLAQKTKQQNKNNGSGAMPALLDRCPHCGTRFFMCVGTQ